LSTQELGLNDEMSQGWESFLTELRRAHIRLSGDPNDLVWEMNKTGGDYTAKLNYLSLQSLNPAEIRWWWSKLWKVKAPPKSILFMWLILNNRVLTWEMLQKRNKIGPGRCSLCKENEETTTHLFLSCSILYAGLEGFGDFIGFSGFVA
jgi:hypothetical protein